MDQNEFFSKALSAIESGDNEELEFLRDMIHPEFIPQLFETWSTAIPWDKKDCYIQLLMDQTDDLLNPMMEDGLNSPTVEVRAYSLCVLRKDFSLFEQLLEGGWVNAAKVDAAITEYRQSLFHA